MRTAFANLSLVFLSMFLLAAGKTGPTKQIQTDYDKSKFTTAPSATYTLFDYLETQMGLHPEPRHPGCACGLSGPYALAKEMQFSPNPVKTKVGQPVEVSYDASQICRKQTILDMNGNQHPPVDQIGGLVLGTVQWEVGSVSQLPLEWGTLDYSGYQQASGQQITVDIKVQCYDSGVPCKSTCESKLTVPVQFGK